MSKKVNDCLDSLLESIVETKEYKNYKKAQKDWEEAKDSQKLLEDFVKERNTLGIYSQGNYPDIEKQEKKVKDLGEKLNNDKNVQRWIEAQNNYQNFISEQAEYLSNKLKFPFSKKQKQGCGGGCC